MGHENELIFGSDIVRGGTYLELWNSGKLIMFAFGSDNTKTITISMYQQDIPLKVVESFLVEVRKRLLD